MRPKLAWSRLLAEGVLIVVSILVAFSIDTWWSERQDRAGLESLLDLLAADIRADAQELSFRAARSDSLLDEMRRVEMRGRGEAGGAPDGELQGLTARIFQTSQTEPSLSAYDVARGSDAWNRIPASIKVALSDYMRGPYSVDRLRDIEALGRLNDIASEYRVAVLYPSASGDLPAASGRLVAFLEDPRTRTWLNQRIASGGAERDWQERWADRLPAVADSLEAIR